MTDSDPWSVQHPENDTTSGKLTNGVNHHNTPQSENSLGGFEDSFIAVENNNTHVNEGLNNSNKPEHQPLPDSQTYLKGLERKLDRLKKNSKLVDALSEKRNDCLRSLVQNDNDLSGSGCNNDLLLELEACIVNSDSAVRQIHRQIQPVQPITVGETVHIVKFDQLEEQHLESDESGSVAEEEDLPASR